VQTEDDLPEKSEIANTPVSQREIKVRR